MRMMLSMVLSMQLEEIGLALIAVGFVTLAVRAASKKSAWVEAAQEWISPRAAVALALACTDALFAVAILLFVLFVGGLPAEVPRSSAGFARWARSARPADVVAELRCVVSTDEKRATDVVNNLLEELTTHFELDVLDAVLAELPSLCVDPDDRSYEVLLEANLALGNFHEVRSLVARLRKAQCLTPRMARTQLSAALETGELSEALAVLRSDPGAARSADTPRLLALGATPAELELLQVPA